MSTIQYTVRTTYPRIYVTSADKTAITARTNTTGSWKAFWDDDFTPYIAGAVASTDLALVDDTNSYIQLLSLGLYGWIEGTVTHHNKLLSAAKYLAQTSTYWKDWPSRRYSILALAYAYNFLRTGVITFSEADRKIIGDALISMSDRTADSKEYLDGHSAGNMMVCFIAGATLYGESGSGYNYNTTATTRITRALDFWYGANAGADSHIQAWRYYAEGGGHWTGAHYSQIGMWKAAHMLSAMRTALIQNTETPHALLQNGEDYHPINSETWLQQIGEWALTYWLRGDLDYYTVHDCARLANPWVNAYQRQGTAFLIRWGGAWRKYLHWMQQQLNVVERARSGAFWAPNFVHEVLWYDPADPAIAPVAPSAASPPLAKTKFFSPPQAYWHRSSWDTPNACVINVECPDRYFRGHVHLNCGAIQIGMKNDLLLGSSGIYKNEDEAAQYSGTHHRYWYQQSLAHSGVPLCDDGTTTHQNYNLTAYQTYPTALGGQLWKTYTTGGTTYIDAYTLDSIRFDGGGEAWLRSVAELKESSDRYDFLYMDIRRAYALDYQHIGGTSERVRGCDIKLLTIKQESVWPIILRVVRMESRASSMVKRDHYHSWNQWSSSYPHGTTGVTRRLSTTGYRGVGQVSVDVYGQQEMTFTQVGGGSTNLAGYAANQFLYNGTNYPPAAAASNRYYPDLAKFRIEIRPAIQRTVDYFVELIQPRLAGENAVPYTWIDEADWYGVRFGASTAEYRIHKTLPIVRTSADVTAPSAPTGLFAAPGNESVTLIWHPNVEGDMGSYKVYYREKVV